MDKPLAKSLHTVTVLVNVARVMRNADKIGGQSWAAYVYEALVALNLQDKPDSYGLANQAIKQLESNQQEHQHCANKPWAESNQKPKSVVAVANVVRQALKMSLLLATTPKSLRKLQHLVMKTMMDLQIITKAKILM